MAKHGRGRSPKYDWWRLWPELHKAELEAFQARQARVETVLQENGCLILDVVWPHLEGPIRLTVGYSPFHPYFPPTVTSAALSLTRHRNPLSGALCLLTQASGQWDPTERVADLIFKQLPQVIEAAGAHARGDRETAGAMEEHAPDPLSSYYQSLGNPMAGSVFFGAAQGPPAGDAGFATFFAPPRNILAGVVLEGVMLADGRPGSTFRLKGVPSDGQRFQGRWVRLRPPATMNPDDILAEAETAIERAFALQPVALQRARELGRADPTFTAITFKEELTYGDGGAGDGWLFLHTGGTPRRTQLIRSYRVGELHERVPIATGLKEKSAVIFGVGAIGSFAALELARAGIGKLRIVDSDVVEPGNSARWPLGRPYWGAPKSVALKAFIEEHYGTEVAAHMIRIGLATSVKSEALAEPNAVVAVRDWIGEADIVLDATASTEHQSMIDLHRRELGKPCIVGYGTEGAAGGVVFRLQGEANGCTMCLREYWDDPDWPKPSAEERSDVTPVGCNAPTFTGASFDLQEVSMEMARAVVGVLAPDLYRRADFGVAVLKLIDNEGRRTPPQWTWQAFPPHTRCKACHPA